jgi:hypothetical protein
MAARQENMAYPETHPLHHTGNIKQMLTEVIEHVRDDVNKVNDPKAQALMETTAEVLAGLVKAYNDFEQKNERAWQ